MENEDLKGNEVETIIKFKSALGIDDPDAAGMHMEVCLPHLLVKSLKKVEIRGPFS